MRADTAGRPRLSVVVPAYQAATYLDRSLGALAASDLPRDAWELIVVDDGSTDGSPGIAARTADVLLGGAAGAPRGPAAARNRGAAAARAPLVAFVDADVLVRPDALRRLAEALEAPGAPDAVFGAYDTHPPAPGLVSQYRNLAHHHGHVEATGEATTFWSGLGAVRAERFAQVGGFDAERYPRPSIEDVELGYRMRRSGARIAIRPEIQGTHLKRWTLRSGVRTDVRDRGLPWMRLLLDGTAPPAARTLNVRPAEQALTALAALGVLAAALSALDARWLGVAAACVAATALANRRLLGFLARARGWPFAAAVVPLRVLYYVLNAGVAATALGLHGLGVVRGLRARRRRLRPFAAAGPLGRARRTGIGGAAGPAAGASYRAPARDR